MTLPAISRRVIVSGASVVAGSSMSYWLGGDVDVKEVQQRRECGAQHGSHIERRTCKEMADYKRFTLDTDSSVYFCDHQSPWQRGSNENTNGLLRQYLPKGVSWPRCRLDAHLFNLTTCPAAQYVALLLQILVALDLAARIAFLKNIEPS